MKSQNKKVVLFLLILFISFFSTNALVWNDTQANNTRKTFTAITGKYLTGFRLNTSVSYPLHLVDIMTADEIAAEVGIWNKSGKGCYVYDDNTKVLLAEGLRSGDYSAHCVIDIWLYPNTEYLVLMGTKNSTGVEYLAGIGVATGGSSVTYPLVMNLVNENDFVFFNGTNWTIGGYGTVSTLYGTIQTLSFDVENNLPNFNISLNKNIICMNKTEISKNINISINANDLENDTIYYSSFTANKILDDFITFQKSFCIGSLCTYYPDYSFINEYIVSNTDNYCIINQDYNNISQFGLNYGLYNTDISNSEDFYLSMDGKCIKDRELIFKFENPTSYSYLEFFNILFSGSNETKDYFNFTLYNDKLEKVLVLKVYRENSTDLNVSYFTTTGEQNIYNGFFSDTNLISSFLVDNMFNNGAVAVKNFTIKFNIETTKYNIPYFDSIISDKRVKYFSFSTPQNDNYDIRFYSMILKGLLNIPVFSDSSTLSSFNVTVLNYPVNLISVFVTDDIHKPLGIYSQQDISISVVNCDEQVLTSDIVPTDFIGFGNALKETNFRFCSMFNGIRTPNNSSVTFDFCSLWHILVYVIAFIVASVFITITLFLFPSISTGIGLLAFSLVAWVGNIFIVELSTGEKIIMSVLFVFGIIIILINLVTANSGQQNTGN